MYTVFIFFVISSAVFWFVVLFENKKGIIGDGSFWSHCENANTGRYRIAILKRGFIFTFKSKCKFHKTINRE